MKLALCLEYPIGQFGGTEVLVLELVRGLAGKHQIVLVSRDDSGAVEKSTLGPLLAGHVSWESSLVSLKQSQRLAQQLADQGVELAHFHFGGNYGWGNRFWRACPIMHLKALGIRCLSTNHGAFSIMDGYCGPQRSRLLKLALFLPAWLSKQVVLTRLEAEVAVSQHDYRALRRWYWPFRDKFRQIYHSRLREVDLHPVLDRTKTILCVGSIGFRKGQTVLASAFSRVAHEYPDWNLILIGRHSEEILVRNIRDTISQQGLRDRIRLVDRCSDEELTGWMKRAAIFAMPSLHEGLGLSLQEALAKGCACIGSRVGGIPDLIQDGDNGLLVEPGNVDQLAAGLDRMMGDEALRARLSLRAPESILEKEMTVSKMIEKYDKLYQEILHGPAPLLPGASKLTSIVPDPSVARN